MIKGIGVDIQGLGSIKKIYNDYLDELEGNIYTEKELSKIDIFQDKYVYLTLVFSFKEAVSKVLEKGFSIIELTDIEIIIEEKIYVNLYNEAKKCKKNLKINNFKLTWDYVDEKIITSAIGLS